MTETICKCDACQKKTDKLAVLRIPIIAVMGEPERHYMDIKDVELCEACAQKIMETYYEIAEAHGSSGLRAIYTEDH